MKEFIKRAWKTALAMVGSVLLLMLFSLSVYAREPVLHKEISNLNDQNWMSGISGDRYLHEINLPGTHDSGMAHLTTKYVSWTAAVKRYARTQNLNIPEQLHGGYRLFDLRWECLYEETGRYDLRICHGDWYNDKASLSFEALINSDDDDPLNGAYTFDVAMDMFFTFLDDNPTETVVVMMSAEGSDGDYINYLMNQYLNDYSQRISKVTGKPYIYPGDGGNKDKPNKITKMPQLKDCRGQMVIVAGGGVNYGMDFPTGGNKTITPQYHTGDAGSFDGITIYSENKWDVYKEPKWDLVSIYDNQVIKANKISESITPGKSDVASVIHTSSNGFNFDIEHLSLGDTPQDIADYVNPRYYDDVMGDQGYRFGWWLGDFVPDSASRFWKTNFPSYLKYVTVKYHLNEGTYGGKDLYSEEILSGMAAPEITPERPGWVLRGFYLDEGLTTKYVSGTPLSRDTDLYARWAQPCKVTYSLNGGTSDGHTEITLDAYIGEPVPEITEPVKKNSMFQGYYLDEALTQKYKTGDKIYGDTTLYAKWLDLEAYCLLIYELNGGQAHGLDRIVTYIKRGEAAPEIYTPVKEGYIQDGFYTDAEFQNRYVPGTPIDGPTTLYLKWKEARAHCQVTYDFNGGTSAGLSRIVTYVERGQAAPEVLRPLKRGYAFDGFYTDEGLTEKYEDGTPLYQNTTLYTKWTDLTEHLLVTYELNGGTSSGMSSIFTYVKKGEAAHKIGRPLKQGCAFDGFYTDADLTNKYVDGTPLYENTTLYVKWTEVGQYIEVYYDLNGGQTKAGNSFVIRYVKKGESAPELAGGVVRDGYTYDGLYFDQDCSNKYQGEPIMENTTLYVGWSMDPDRGDIVSALLAGTPREEHVHKMEWVTTKEATETTEGEMDYRCSECGYVQYSVPTSAYYVFNKNTADKIHKAAAGATVEITTDRWLSFHKMIRDALQDAPEVSLKVTYKYNGKDYKLLVPAGADLSKLFETTGFAGFRNLAEKYEVQ